MKSVQKARSEDQSGARQHRLHRGLIVKDFVEVYLLRLSEDKNTPQ